VIASNSKRIEFSGGWPCLIVDQLLEAKFLKEALAELRIGEYQTLQEDEHQVQFQALTSMKLARFFLSTEFRLFLKSHTGSEWQFDPTSWIQLRRMTPKSPALPRHTDRQTGNQAVCLFYLNENWSPGQGSELCLHRSFVEADTEAFVLEPQLNRLVFFEANQDAWHSVRPLNFGERLSVICEWRRK